MHEMVSPYYKIRPGQNLGSNYVVLRFLGAGWEGEVFEVQELGTGIERAAKIYYPHRDLRGRALRSYALKLNRFKDIPIVIKYHHCDKVRLQGREVQFVVSEYVDGELLSGLQKRQRGKRFTDLEALHIIRALAEGIEPIHQAREYHGDIHTDNIIIRRKGVGYRIKLLDFFDLGKPNRDRIAADVIDLIKVFYELIGGRAHYARVHPVLKQVICGLKHGVILSKFRTAGQLKTMIDNLDWD